MSGSERTLVIGASAAGLAVAASLKAAGKPVEIFETSSHVGAAWRNHYDRLHLHTPKSASSLPGLPMPADWPRYPARLQVVEYLERYCEHHGLEPRTTRPLPASSAMGTPGSSRPRATRRAARTSSSRRATRAGRYARRGPASISTAASSCTRACEQAIDLVERGAKPHLAVRSAVNVIPRDALGVPILQLGIVMRRLPTSLADALAWPLIQLMVGDITKYGLKKLPYGPNTQIERDRRVPLLDIGTMDHIRNGRILVHGDVTRFTATGAVFEDGVEVDFDAVVTATGYRPAHRFRDRGGVADVTSVVGRRRRPP